MRNAQDVVPGERLMTDVRHGRILSRVEEVDASARPGRFGPSWMIVAVRGMRSERHPHR